MLQIIILAAGRGTRMKSSLPKVLHPLGGRAMINHVLDKAKKLGAESMVVVIGHQAETMREHLQTHYSNDRLAIVEQTETLGTAHAIRQCLPNIRDFQSRYPQGKTLILYGDVPLIETETLKHGIEKANREQCELVFTAKLQNPYGYGRILVHSNPQNHRFIEKIIEEKHLSASQKLIDEVNTGVMILESKSIIELIEKIGKSPSGEYYLTDIVELNSFNKRPMIAHLVENPQCFFGVNDRLSLAKSERFYQDKQAETLMSLGAHLIDAKSINIRGEVEIGEDVTIDVGVVLIGKVKLADRVKVGAYSVLENCAIGEGTLIEPYSHINQAMVGEKAVIGPFARLRPGTKIAESAHIGNFVEVKNSNVGKQSKANHLAYLGDADIGERVNVGAGVITCNYDGANKFRTTIEDDVFIGSDTQLVAPVVVEKGATLGAGTTLTRKAPANKLTLSRAPQKTLEHWHRPQKLKK